MSLQPTDHLSFFIRKARALGFIAVGFSRPGRPLFFDRFREWIQEGKHGDMRWMERHMDLRENPARLLDNCRTVISLAYPYSCLKPRTPEGFTIARYAEPGKTDYHRRLKIPARKLADSIMQLYPGTRTRVCIDSAPILERSFACASGIGFIGKNNALIIPGHGSFFFLLEILTTARLPFPEPTPMETRCGDCTLCVDVCPTGALEAPFTLNASVCLSYLTIEYRGDVPPSFSEKMNGCFLGCDACQDVCPYNRTEKAAGPVLPSIDEILKMKEAVFNERFGGTALNHAGLDKIQSNIRAMKSGIRGETPTDRGGSTIL